jgi:hypothetical protein
LKTDAIIKRQKTECYMKYLILSILAAIGLSSFVMASTMTIQGKGKVKLLVSSGSKGFYEMSSGKVTISYKEWAEGKIIGAVVLKSFKNCDQPKRLDFIGIDDGMGKYKLFSDETNIMNNSSYGELSQYDSKIDFRFFEETILFGYDTKEFRCGIKIQPDNFLSFKIN